MRAQLHRLSVLNLIKQPKPHHTVPHRKQHNSPKPPNRRIFSGIQPTGSIHLGNYLGAITQWLQYQNNNEDTLIMLADLHSITLPQDPRTLHGNILEVTATLLACGIDPAKVTLFQQSTIPAHSELCWYLSCVATMARLAHLPAYKEKSSTLKDVPLGLFVYPVLQAADILTYKSTHVPVGEDQLQHIQLTQELARMFNGRFGATFPAVSAIVPGKEVARLKSLRNPEKKMSKSDRDVKSRIGLTDSDDEIVSKIRKAVTDCTSEVGFDPIGRPGVSNLITMHSCVTRKSVEEIVGEAVGVDTGEYKRVVSDVLVAFVRPIREEIGVLLKDKGYLTRTLQAGGSRATELSERTLDEVRSKLGLRVVNDPVKIKTAR